MDGTFTLTAHSVADLGGLTITPAKRVRGYGTVGYRRSPMTAPAVSTAGTTSTTLTVNPVADQPVVTASAATINGTAPAR